MQDTVTKGGRQTSSSHVIKFPFPILLNIFKLIFFSCPFLSGTNTWPCRRAEAECVYVYNVPIPLFGQMLFHKSTKAYLILEGLARMLSYLFPLTHYYELCPLSMCPQSPTVSKLMLLFAFEKFNREKMREMLWSKRPKSIYKPFKGHVWMMLQIFQLPYMFPCRQNR